MHPAVGKYQKVESVRLPIERCVVIYNTPGEDVDSSPEVVCIFLWLLWVNLVGCESFSIFRIKHRRTESEYRVDLNLIDMITDNTNGSFF